MHLADCEITHRHIRGCNVVFLFGTEKLTDGAAAELLAEYHRAYGPGLAPAYVSPAGWQVLPPEQAEEAKPASKRPNKPVVPQAAEV